MQYEGDKSWRNPPEPIPENLITEVVDADVVVAGLGYAGTAAARAAAEQGVKVVGIDLMLEDKYHSWGLDVGHINSKFLEHFGVPKVDPIDLFNEMMRRNQGQANPQLVMKFCQNCGAAFDWYLEPASQEQIDGMFVRFWPAAKHFDGELSGFRFWQGTAVFPGMRGEMYDQVKDRGEVHGHALSPEDLENMRQVQGKISLSQAQKLQFQKIRALGGRLDFGTKAEQLVQDASGRVLALICKQGDRYIRYNASQGVVLALGDFGGNRQMCRDLLGNIYDLFLDKDQQTTYSSRPGRGLQLGVWAGGKIEPGPLPVMGGDYITYNGLLHTFAPLLINDKGERFCNELFGDPCIAGKVGTMIDMDHHYVVFDSNIAEMAEYAPPAHTSFEHDNDRKRERLMQEAIAAGAEGVACGGGPGGASRLYAGSTPEELASRLGLTSEAEQRFVKSFYHYNELCHAGRDDDFGKDAKALLPLEHGPYFAERATTRAGIGRGLCVVGGLVTDGNQQVLDEKLHTIPGLYASGNNCGRRFGPQYNTPISGMSIGMAITLGRELGLYFGNQKSI